MTSFILTTICAIALSAPAVSAQVDTMDIYTIDGKRVEFFDGSQLIGKTIVSYSIYRGSERTKSYEGPIRDHIITTLSGLSEQSSSPWIMIDNADAKKGSIINFVSEDVRVEGVVHTEPTSLSLYQETRIPVPCPLL